METASFEIVAMTSPETSTTSDSFPSSATIQRVMILVKLPGLICWSGFQEYIMVSLAISYRITDSAFSINCLLPSKEDWASMEWLPLVTDISASSPASAPSAAFGKNLSTRRRQRITHITLLFFIFYTNIPLHTCISGKTYV